MARKVKNYCLSLPKILLFNKILSNFTESGLRPTHQPKKSNTNTKVQHRQGDVSAMNARVNREVIQWIGEEEEFSEEETVLVLQGESVDRLSASTLARAES
jgi:hypothetical protein